MRLLFIVPYAPTPIRTRPYHLLRELSRNGHALTLATLYSDANERAALAQWSAAGIKVLAASLSRTRALSNLPRIAFTGAPLQAAYCWQPELERLISQTLTGQTYDIVHVEHLRGAWYGVRAQAQLSAGARATPVIWDSVDSISHLFAQAARTSKSRTNRWIARLELGRTRAYERQLARRFDRTLVVSQSERAAFCDLVNPSATNGSGCEQVLVVPNGVDVTYFTPPQDARRPDTILFSGKMSYHANITAAFYLLDEVMPRVWATLPDTRVTIVGQKPPPSLLQRSNDRVLVTGYVPDIRPYLQSATVACAPVQYSAGIQNKVLEAMACGTPVVATPEAVAALRAQPGHDLLVGKDAAQLSAQLLQVMTDSTLRQALQTNGRQYVEAHHLWAQSAALLESIYAAALRNTAGAGGNKHVHGQC